MTSEGESAQLKYPGLPSENVITAMPHAYLSIAKERGGDIEQILLHSNFKASSAEEMLSQQEIEANDFYELISAIIKFVGDDGIGLEVGFRQAPTAYGDFGYALLCSQTLQDVMDLCQRFWHLNTESLPLRIFLEDGFCVMELQISAQIPEPHFHLTYESGLATIVKCFQVLLGDQVDDVEVWIADEEPVYLEKARQLLGNVSYGKPAFQFRFPEKWLKPQLPLYNPAGYQLAFEKCLAEERFRKNKLEALLANKVKAQICLGENGYPNLEQVAESLHLTSRTLRRRLEKEGMSFKVLLEEVKCKDAIRILEQSDLEVQAVAERLGYSEHGNFTRAFKQWTGKSPSEYRNKNNLQ